MNVHFGLGTDAMKRWIKYISSRINCCERWLLTYSYSEVKRQRGGGQGVERGGHAGVGRRGIYHDFPVRWINRNQNSKFKIQNFISSLLLFPQTTRYAECSRRPVSYNSPSQYGIQSSQRLFRPVMSTIGFSRLSNQPSARAYMQSALTRGGLRRGISQ